MTKHIDFADNSRSQDDKNTIETTHISKEVEEIVDWSINLNPIRVWNNCKASYLIIVIKIIRITEA